MSETRTAPGLRVSERKNTLVELQDLTDEELIERARGAEGPQARAFLELLYERHYRRVARWSLRITRDPEKAAELAQEVFLRVHSRLHTFRAESRFTTWLYTITRRVGINRGISEQRREMEPLDPEFDGEIPPEALERLSAGELRRALAEALPPREAEVMVLHYVHGLTLPAITEMLALDNPSGAKAFIVNGKRKLKRHLEAADNVVGFASKERSTP